MKPVPKKQCCDYSSPLKGDDIKIQMKQLPSGWKVIEEHHLEKEYIFKDFAEALAFTNRIGDLAEKINHHPDITLSWGKVKIIVWTHSVGGLSEKDFIFAQGCDAHRL